MATEKKVLIMMADYGHDPTETAVPYWAMKDAGFNIQFATESGKQPEGDKRMLQGITQKLLGASRSVVAKYEAMANSPEMQSPLSWSEPGFTLDPYNLVLFPGGHDKAVRQLIDSPKVHELVVDYFPKTRKPSSKAVAAVCHGVMVLSESKDDAGRSVIYNCDTATLTVGMERLAFWGTWAFLGDYYKTYGAGSDNTATSVQKALAHPHQLKGSMIPTPLVVEDEAHNYLTARFPGDAQDFGKRIVQLVQNFS